MTSILQLTDKTFNLKTSSFHASVLKTCLVNIGKIKEKKRNSVLKIFINVNLVFLNKLFTNLKNLKEV